MSGFYAQPQSQAPGPQNQGAQAATQQQPAVTYQQQGPDSYEGQWQVPGSPDYQVSVTTSDSRNPQSVAPPPSQPAPQVRQVPRQRHTQAARRPATRAAAAPAHVRDIPVVARLEGNPGQRVSTYGEQQDRSRSSGLFGPRWW